MDESKRILRQREVLQMTGLSRTTLWRLEKNGDFPQRLKLGPRAVGWPASAVDEWLGSRQPVES